MNFPLAATIVLALVNSFGSMQAADLTGTWIWTTPINSQPRESTLRLQYDSEGDWISGTFQASDHHWAIPITKAAYKDGIFQVVAEPGYGEQTFRVTFSGCRSGDTIVGKFQVQHGDRIREFGWVARRLK